MKTHLKNGELSEYGFACGYVQREKNLPHGDVWMYKEHNTYHVRRNGSEVCYYCKGDGSFLTGGISECKCYSCNGTGKANNWQSFDMIKEARKAYREMIRINSTSN